ncbi:Peptide chain release factor 2 [Candidatus Hepatincolaceae symbiont of Richtersius coronifer]
MINLDSQKLDNILYEINSSISILKKKTDKEALLKSLANYEISTNNPELWKDANKAKLVLKNYSDLKNQLENFENILNKQKELIELSTSSGYESDASLHHLVLQEAQDLYSKIQKEKVKILFDTEDDKNSCYLEIHAGSGGADSQDFASMLLRMYIKWCDMHKFKVNIVDENKAEIAGLKSVVLKIEGEYAYGWLKAESGVHRLVRLSPFNADGKRHTSFVAISVYAEVDTNENIIFEDKSLKIDTFRASGAGGQHVNTTDSAVRITHIPTGIVVSCQAERSQHKNKQTALSLLKAKIHSVGLQKRQQDKKDLHDKKQAIDFGSQIRSYILHPYNLVKDHRTSLESFNPKAVLDGKIDDFIISYLSNVIA